MKFDKISIANLIIEIFSMLLILIGYLIISFTKNYFNIGIIILAVGFIIFDLGLTISHKFDIKQNELKELKYINDNKERK